MPSKFRIEFNSGDSLEAGSLQSLIKKIGSERDGWGNIIKGLSENFQHIVKIEARYDEVIHRIKHHDWPKEENIKTLILGSDTPVFPPLNSSVGAKIRELLDLGLRFEVLSLIAYWQYINRLRERSEIYRDHAPGMAMRLGAAIYWATSSADSMINGVHGKRRLSDEQERLANAIAELEGEVQAAQSAKKSFDHFLARSTATVVIRLRRINKVGLLITGRAKKFQEGWTDRFEETHKSFVHKLQYKAPVALWGRNEEIHQERAATALSWFTAILIITALCCGIIILFFGDDIAATFYRMRCVSKNDCVEVFSAKGPLTVGSLLLAASLAIWGLRFSSKLYLSERHLAIGAAERKAFTESYLALVSDQVVTREQEAIVLAALFRPSSDGVIKDDDGGLDISAATILAKALSGPVAKQ